MPDHTYSAQALQSYFQMFDLMNSQRGLQAHPGDSGRIGVGSRQSYVATRPGDPIVYPPFKVITVSTQQAGHHSGSTTPCIA